MKLTRKEQNLENQALDLFVHFAGAAADDLAAKRSLRLTSGEKEAFNQVQNRIRRIKLTSGVPLEHFETAQELKDAAFFGKLTPSGLKSFTEKDIEDLRKAHDLISKIRSKARERAKHLAGGRDKLQTILEEDDAEAQRIKEARGGNVRIMLEKRTTEDVRLGGIRGGIGRKEKLSKEEIQDIASLGGQASSRAHRPNKPKKEDKDETGEKD